MSDEIKEILDWLKDFNRDKPFGMSIYDRKILLDYITNLQEELKSANESITWWTNRFKTVEKENERLKELDENYPIEEQLEEALKYENIYKSRCEKAEEFAKNYKEEWVEYDEVKKDMDCLLNILGGDKE